MSDPLVSTAWLAERLGSHEIKVVDATWFMPGESRTGADAYAAGHIPGARNRSGKKIARGSCGR